MMLEEVRRRNRRRIAMLAGISFLNYWLAISALVPLVVFMGLSKAEDAERDNPGPTIVLGLLVAFGLAAWIVTKRLVLAARSTIRGFGATVSDGDVRLRVRNLAEELSIAIGRRVPEVVLLEDRAPNTLTVGMGRHATIVLTTGLVDALARDELEAVLASQIWAIHRLDVGLQTAVVACVNGAIGIQTDLGSGPNPIGLVGAMLTWPTSQVARRLRAGAYQRTDFGADDLAVATTRNPDALRRALEKLLADERVVSHVSTDNAPLWFEPVPSNAMSLRRRNGQLVAGRSDVLAELSMRPSLESRIDRLAKT